MKRTWTVSEALGETFITSDARTTASGVVPVPW